MQHTASKNHVSGRPSATGPALSPRGPDAPLVFWATCAAAIRSPHLSTKDRIRRVDGKLIELGLSERRDSLVGSSVKKYLSGGERKRLNIGLDMISSADVFLFDEPTSGLSSKDSEHVIEIIRGLSHNKIVLVTIHTPTSKIFQMCSL